MFSKHLSVKIACLLVFATTSLAQQSVNSGSLTGRVEDATGGVIAGANVIAINLEKNQKWTTTTDIQGRYRFLYVPVGSYQLRAEKQGFQPAERQLTLTIAQALEIRSGFSVGGITEQMSVTLHSPVLELTRSELAQTILPREVDNLPLNGRNYLDLAALTPGVSRANPVANQRFAETSAVPGRRFQSLVNVISTTDL